MKGKVNAWRGSTRTVILTKGQAYDSEALVCACVICSKEGAFRSDRSSIRFPPVLNTNHNDCLKIIVDLVNEAMRTNANAITVRGALQFDCTRGFGVSCRLRTSLSTRLIIVFGSTLRSRRAAFVTTNRYLFI